MNQRQSKTLRKEAKQVSKELPWENYESINNGNAPWQTQIVLAECGKALYKELKKQYYQEGSK